MILTRLWFYNLGKIFALYSLISLSCISHHWLSFKKSQLGTAPAGVSRSYSNVQNNKWSKLKRKKFGLSFFILCTRMVFCHFSVHRACSHSTGRASPPECFQLTSAQKRPWAAAARGVVAQELGGSVG